MTGTAFTLDVAPDGLAVLTFDVPGAKVNAFSTPVMAELAALAAELARSGTVRALLLRSGKPDSFIVGADVHELDRLSDPEAGRRASRAGQEIFESFARLPVPTTAAIGGSCLGGGTELALACDFRLMSDAPAAVIGLPEVRLGILPGWGGTQRLPRLVGLRAGLDLILTGRALDARQARRIGLVDDVVPSAIFDDWCHRFARGTIGREKPTDRRRPTRLAELALERNPAGRALVIMQARRGIRKRTRGQYPAPLEALAAVAEGWGQPPAAAFEIESRHLAALIGTPTQRNLLRLFFWTEEVKKETGAADLTIRPREVTRVGVLGAGVMGGGIAQLVADRGMPVRMKDITAEALGHGYAAAARIWRHERERRRLTPRELAARMARLSGGLDYAGFARCEVTLEAVVETLAVKQAVLAEWEAVVPDTAIFASNTSALSIGQIAARARRPGRVVGMHFFNPVHRMPLVEVIRGERTGEETVATVFTLARRLGKTPVVVRDGPGFLVNRLLSPYLAEAVGLVLGGCSVEGVDDAMVGFGMPVGPLALLDDVGIDVAVKAGRVMAAAFPDRLPLAAPLDALAHAGRLGRKGGRGFYRYDGDQRRRPDPEALRLLGVAPAGAGALPAQAIEARLVLPMINEAAYCLMDAVVASPAKLDLAMVLGTGFPPFRGGLLRYADALGLEAVAARLSELAERLGERFKPAPLILDLARRGARFHPR